jgi:hypothetical protein
MKGLPVMSGTKYILRTEIMFTRVNTDALTQMQRTSYQKNPEYLKALSLYLRSWELEQLGDSIG